MRIVAVSQARTGSTRLPGKILKKINGQTLLEIHIDRIKASKKISELIIATTTNKEDDAVIDLCNKLGTKSFRGNEQNVLDRFYNAVRNENADYIVRLTADCPLIDAQLIDEVITQAVNKELDYCSNVLLETFPDGQDIEVMRFSALETAWKEADKNYQKEHVTPFIRENSSFNGGTKFKSDNIAADKDYGKVRMTVDEQKDLEVIELLVLKLGTERTWKEYADHYLANTQINDLNSGIKRNEGFKKN